RRWLGGALVGLAVLGLAAGAGGCKKTTSSSGGGGGKAQAMPKGDGLWLVPPEAAGVLRLNIPKLRDTALFKKAISDPKMSPTMRYGMAQLTQAGVEIGRDIENITVAAADRPGGGRNYLVVVKGNFDKLKMTKAMRKVAKRDIGPLLKKKRKGIAI